MKRRIQEKLLAQARAAPEDPKLAERRRMREAAAAKKAELEAMRKKIQAQLLSHKKTEAPPAGAGDKATGADATVAPEDAPADAPADE